MLGEIDEEKLMFLKENFDIEKTPPQVLLLALKKRFKKVEKQLIRVSQA